MQMDSLGLGFDLEDIERFEKYSQDKTLPFLKRVYTEKEIEYCFSSKYPAKHLAVRFCAKEAIYKAFCSIGVFGLGFQDVEIVNDSTKVPQVEFLTEKLDGYVCKISLSHSENTAAATVMVFKK